MKHLIAFVCIASAVSWFHGYHAGKTHKPQPTTAEILQHAFDAGQHFTEGWQACEECYQIKWVEGRGWICSRFDKDVPPGFHPIISPAAIYAGNTDKAAFKK